MIAWNYQDDVVPIPDVFAQNVLYPAVPDRDGAANPVIHYH